MCSVRQDGVVVLRSCLIGLTSGANLDFVSPDKKHGGGVMLHLCSGTDLVEFSFESKAVANLPEAVLLRLARRSSAFNTRMGLTGRLALRDGRFHQSLEGRIDMLLPVAARILADPRHESIRTLAFRAVAARRFSGWEVEGFGFEKAGEAIGDNLCFLTARPPRRRAPMPASVHSIGTGTI
jgi:hypothetical protein